MQFFLNDFQEAFAFGTITYWVISTTGILMATFEPRIWRLLDVAYKRPTKGGGVVYWLLAIIFAYVPYLNLVMLAVFAIGYFMIARLRKRATTTMQNSFFQDTSFAHL